MVNHVDTLKNAPFKISQKMIKKIYTNGSYIIRPGEHNDYLFFLIEGAVEISQYTYEGNEIFIKKLDAYDVFGELEIFDKGFKTNAVTAETDCVLMLLHRDDIFEWMKVDSDFSKYLLGVIVNCYTRICARTDKLTTLTIKQRLLLIIFKYHEKGNIELLQKTALMQEVSAPKRSINRVLKECIDEEYIQYSNKKFSINNVEKLSNFVKMFI